ncbi:hypothetical protein CHLRE_09g392914v5 [Chlamydomonas reinhardtii]|nr:uncharacterized protein CHLRE_09g392914v5 [Chlamydomonas reinhardtii]PNW78874.1 hypothetical protein CHLRE_09g392914v5 [Chlamydomonas reinhardtii]
MTAEGSRASKRAQLRNVLRGLHQAAPDSQLLPDNEPTPAPPSLPEDKGATPSPSGDSEMATGAPTYPPWAPLPPNSPGDIRRDPDLSGSNGAPSFPPSDAAGLEGQGSHKPPPQQQGQSPQAAAESAHAGQIDHGGGTG